MTNRLRWDEPQPRHRAYAEACAELERNRRPRRSIRVPSQLWEAFGRLCADNGTDRSKAINAYMAAEIRAAEARRSVTTGEVPTLRERWMKSRALRNDDTRKGGEESQVCGTFGLPSEQSERLTAAVKDCLTAADCLDAEGET